MDGGEQCRCGWSVMESGRDGQLDADLTSDVDASSSRDVLTVEGT